MEYLFYCLTFPFIYFEVYSLVNAREIIYESKNARDTIEEIQRTGHGNGRNISPDYMRAYMVDFFYMVWSVIGLLSSQWVFFVCLFLLTLISSLLRDRTLQEASVNDNVRFDRANSLFSIVLLVLIVCNKYLQLIEVPRSLLEVLGVW